MTPRTWALVGGSVGTLALGFYARPFSTGTNRVYVSIRRQMEFEPLATLPGPILANFCIYTDPLSAKVSHALKEIVNGDTPFPVSCVDIEADEPDVQPIVKRYAISKIPTVVALRGGNPISYFSPETPEGVLEDLQRWIKGLDS